MKKLTALCLLIFAGMACAFSQSEVTSVTYNKTSQPALMLDLPYNESVSEGFIVDNLKKIGFDPETKGKLFWKQNKLNGFYIFKDVRFEGLKEPLDVYFKVEQKGKKSKDQSTIYMLVARGENFISSGSDQDVYEASRKFLNGFVVQSAAYKLDLDIKDQEDAVKKAEKRLDKLKDDEKDMTKKIENLQKDLQKNRQDQDSQQKAVENERKKLADLKQQKS